VHSKNPCHVRGGQLVLISAPFPSFVYPPPSHQRLLSISITPTPTPTTPNITISVAIPFTPMEPLQLSTTCRDPNPNFTTEHCRGSTTTLPLVHRSITRCYFAIREYTRAKPPSASQSHPRPRGIHMDPEAKLRTLLRADSGSSLDDG
jgi:hypothetical protein